MTKTPKGLSHSEVLDETQKYLDDCAAGFLRLRAWQLSKIDDWTTLELKPATVDKIVDGLQTAAANIRALLNKPDDAAADDVADDLLEECPPLVVDPNGHRARG